MAAVTQTRLRCVVPTCRRWLSSHLSHTRDLARPCAQSQGDSTVFSRASSPVGALGKLEASIERARDAVGLSAAHNSGDMERNESVKLSRYAIEQYDRLRSKLEDGSDEKAAFADRFDEPIQELKNELYASRKQRVWMYQHDWF